MQCTANSKSGKSRCRNGSIPGGNVCRYHGGGAPQVKAKAELRVKEALEAMLPKGLSRYDSLIASEQDSVALNAVRDLLDRTGHKPTERQEITNYTPEDVETLANLDDIELAAYIELRRKVTQKPITGITIDAKQS